MSGYDKLFSAIVTCSSLLQTADWQAFSLATCHVYCDLTLWPPVNFSYLTVVSLLPLAHACPTMFYIPLVDIHRHIVPHSEPLMFYIVSFCKKTRENCLEKFDKLTSSEFPYNDTGLSQAHGWGYENCIMYISNSQLLAYMCSIFSLPYGRSSWHHHLTIIWNLQVKKIFWTKTSERRNVVVHKEQTVVVKSNAFNVNPRPVARILWRGVMSMSNAFERSKDTRLGGSGGMLP